MDRSDWMIVGTRLLGLYIFALALQHLVDAVLVYERLITEQRLLSLSYLVNIGIGLALMLRAPSIEAWFRERDGRQMNKPDGHAGMRR